MGRKQIKKYEIEVFDSIADSSTYEISVGNLYKLISDSIRKHKIQLKGSMLEAGCGTGAFGKQLLKTFKDLKIIGVDISPKMVKRANDGTNKYHAITGDLENGHLFKPRSLDFIYCPFVLHHFPSLDKVMKNYSKWLKPKGFIIIIEPNGLNIISRFSKLLRVVIEKTLGKQYIIEHQLATPNENDHEPNFYLSSLKENNFKTNLCKTKYVELRGKNMFSLGGLKTVIASLINNLLPTSPLTHSVVLILAKNNN